MANVGKIVLEKWSKLKHKGCFLTKEGQRDLIRLINEALKEKE